MNKGLGGFGGCVVVVGSLTLWSEEMIESADRKRRNKYHEGFTKSD